MEIPIRSSQIWDCFYLEETDDDARPASRIRRFDLAAAILVSLTVGFSAGKLWSNTSAHVRDAFHRMLYYDAPSKGGVSWQVP